MNVFSGLKHVDYELPPEKLEECFIMSMMNVMDEIRRMRKYEHLLFVEFLEMLCRVAYVALKLDDTIEYKVFYLLEVIYNKMYASNEMNSNDYPLVPVDEEYQHVYKGDDTTGR